MFLQGSEKCDKERALSLSLSPVLQQPVVLAASTAIPNDDHSMGQLAAGAVGHIHDTLTVELIRERNGEMIIR